MSTYMPSASAILLTPQEQSAMQRLASKLKRSAIKHQDNMDNVHRDVIEAFMMSDQAMTSDQAKNWFFEPVLFTSSNKSNFYKNIKTFFDAELFYNLNERIFRSTLKNRWELDDEKQMKEIENTKEEMDITTEHMDRFTFESINKRKKEG